jgi:Protein of unknown function (DUF3455)
MSARFGITVAVSALLVACASAPPAPAVPDGLKPGAQERVAFVRHARGVQIYRCDAAEGGAFKWTFVAPEAQLFDNAASQAVLGTHGAGPFWQGSDGSRVVGKVKTRADAANAAADIPWLLLTTTAEGPSGQMSSVKSIQRIHTVGGAAPAAGCSATTDVGKQARVPYTADYVFFVGG